jgi:hypothetical protein
LSDLIKEAESEKKDFDKAMAELNTKILEERAKKEALKAKEAKQLELEKEYLQAK